MSTFEFAQENGGHGPESLSPKSLQRVKKIGAPPEPIQIQSDTILVETRPFLVNPRKAPKLTWDAINVLMLMGSLGEIFYSFAFSVDSCTWTYLTIIELAVDSFFICDCVLNFFTTYADSKTGVEVKNHNQIIVNYLTGWFVLDILSSFPFDRVICAVDSGNEDQDRIRLLKILRLIKAARFLRMLRIASRLEEELGHLLHNGVRFIKFLCLMMLFIHMCACIWFATIYYADCQIPMTDPVTTYAPCGCDPDQGCRDWNWLIKYAGGTETQYQIFMQNRSAYTVSLYYSIVTLTTLGYGDVTPSNNVEQVVSSGLALGGAVMFSILIGSIGNLMTMRNVISRSMEETVHKFVDLCRYKGMAADFEKKVRKQVTHIINRAPHKFIEINILPRVMQDQILVKIAQDLFGQLDFFKNLEPDYLARLAKILRPCTFHPGDVIFKAKNIASEMYFIVTGYVSILKDKSRELGAADSAGTDSAVQAEDGDLLKSLYDVPSGRMIGEVELFPATVLDKSLRARNKSWYTSPTNSRFRMHTARAKTRCELLELRQEDLEGVIKLYMPDLYDAILSHAINSAESYEAYLSLHEEEMSIRFRQRHLQWQRLVDEEARSNPLALSTVRGSKGNGVDVFHATRTEAIVFATSQPRGPATEKNASGYGRGRALEELRQDVQDMKEQLGQVLSALRSRSREPSDALKRQDAGRAACGQGCVCMGRAGGDAVLATRVETPAEAQSTRQWDQGRA